MKIAHVVSTFYPHHGGMGAVVYDEAGALARRGHQVTVLTMRYPGDVEVEERDGFFIKQLSPIFRLGDGGVVSWKDQLSNFDVIHLHVPWYGAISGAIAECVRIQKPFVVTIHMVGKPRGIVKNVFKFVDEIKTNKKLFKYAKKIFVVNKNYFLNSYKGADQAIELPNLIDTNIFSPGEAQRNIFGELNKPDTKIILFVGNLLPLKRLDLLLKAVANGEKNWRLAVVGGGYAEAEYKKLAEKLGISNRVTFFGSVERQKLPLFYRSADVVVVPSDTESFSLVAAEALACGTPVVASDNAGLVGALKNISNITFFSAGNSVALTDAVRQVFMCGNDEARQLSIRGKNDVNERYTIDNHLNVLESVYKTLL